MHLTIHRNTTTKVADINVGETATFTSVLMGEHKITARCIHPTPIAVALGDYVVHNNEKYYLNLVPTVQKIDNITYSYDFVFEAQIYSLFNKKMIDEGAMDFSYTGTAEEHLLLLLVNINSIDSGWSIADVAETEPQTLTYVNENCRKALNTIAEAFGLEFRLVGKAIYLVSTIAVDTTLTFEYGKGKGLYTLTRQAVDDANVVTRVYGFGSTRNIDYDYRAGQRKLVFESRFLEANTDIFGYKEGVYNDDDIYPHRKSTIEAVDAEDSTKVIDTTIDFNINDYLIEGTTAEIHFLTGALAGYTFEISSFNNTTKEINFIPFVENNGYELPNDVNFAEIDDEYTLLGIKMPQSYIDTAETDLQAKTAQFLAENSYPVVTYQLAVDEKFIRDNNVELAVGQKVTVLDAALGIDTKIRVSRISYPLVNPQNITAEISDFIVYTVQEQLIQTAVNTTKATELINRNSAELSRRNTLNRRKLQNLIYDADGYFDTGNIKPLSIETAMLSVGSKSQNFGLSGVTIQPNYEADENAIHISNGALVHYEIEIDGLGYIWQIDPYTNETLDPVKPYYVYARCSKVALIGTWVLSDIPMKPEVEIGFYHFNLGVLYAVAEGRRDFDFTKGMTFITGDTITTGRLQSLDELNFIDLSQNKMHFGDDETYLDWNNLEEGKLKVSKAVIDQSLMATNLWAEDATLGDWRIKDGKISSVEEYNGNPRAQLNGTNGKMVFKSPKTIYNFDGSTDTVVQTLEFDSELGQIKSAHPQSTQQEASEVLFDSQGVRVCSNGRFVDPANTSSYKAAVIGDLKINHSTSSPFSVAGVFGRVINTVSQAAKRMGGVFIGLQSYGRFYGIETIAVASTTFTASDISEFISCYNNTNCDVYLPADQANGKHSGRVIYVKRVNAAVRVYGNGSDLLLNSSTLYVDIADGDCWFFVFDGNNWCAQKLIR